MPTPSFCPNCYHPNPGEYCPQCGQNQAERRVTLRAMFSEFLDEQFGVNGRLPRTLKLLMFKPGFLTTEYFEGRVQQYIPPLRLYILTSLVFFAIFLTSEANNVTIQRDREAVREEIARDTALQNRIRSGRQRGPMIGIQLDAADTTNNWLENPKVNLGFKPLERAVERRLHEFAAYGEEEGTRRVVRAVIAQMPKAFFILLPFYAFLLWLFFHRQRRYYVEHFVMGLHLHAFGFVAMLPMTVLDFEFLPEGLRNVGNIISPFILLWIFVYIFLALRRVYRQGRWMTGLKYFVLCICYTVFFGIAILGSAVLALAAG